MICNLSAVEIDKYIKYVYAKIIKDKIIDFDELAKSIYIETGGANNKNSLTYLQMLPSVFMRLAALSKDFQNLVPDDQVAKAYQRLKSWESDILNVQKDLGLLEDISAAALIVDAGKDLSIRAFNRLIVSPSKSVLGLESDLVLKTNDFSNLNIRVYRFPRTNLRTPFVAITDRISKSPILGLSLPVQDEEVAVEVSTEEGILGYIRPLEYYQNGKLISLEDLKALGVVKPEDMIELEVAKAAYDSLFAFLKAILAESNSESVTLKASDTPLNFQGNYNKFDWFDMGTESKAKNLSIAGEYYKNGGKGIIIRSAYTGEYVTKATDPDAPELPGVTNASGTFMPYKGYYALVTMPNGKKFWVSIRPSKLESLSDKALGKFMADVTLAKKSIDYLVGNSIANQTIVDSIVKRLSDEYYIYTASDYDIFFSSNFNVLSNTYVLRMDFILKNSAITSNVPSLYIDNLEGLDTAEDLITKLNEVARIHNLPINLDTKSLRYNIALDPVTKEHIKLSNSEAGARFQTTVSDNIFFKSFLSFTVDKSFEASQKAEDAKPETEVTSAAAAAVSAKEQEIADAIAKAQAFMEAALNRAPTSADPFSLNYKGTERVITKDDLAKLKKILPPFISFQDLDTIAHRLNTKGIPFGYFEDRVAYLSSIAPYSVGYHEAFHAVFRLTLTDSEISEYLKAARERVDPALLSTESLKEFRALRALSSSITDKQLEELILEEDLANGMQSYILKRDTSSILKRLYDKLLNIIRWITDPSRAKIESLYEKISEGGFANATIKPNRFSNVGYGVYDIIPGTQNFDESDSIIRTVAAWYVEDRPLGSTIRDVINDLAKFYNPQSSENLALIRDGKASAEKLAARYVIYSHRSTAAIIEREVATLLYSTYKYDPAQDDFVDLEAEFGDVSNTKFDRTIDEVGGFDSVPKEVRAFIIFTTYMSVDDLTGKPLRKIIDGPSIYANLERTMSGKTPKESLQMLKTLSLYNPQIAAVYSKLKDRTKLVEATVDTTGNEEDFFDLNPDKYEDNLEGKQLMMKFFKALEKTFINHLQVIVSSKFDENENEIKSNRVFSSNRQDAGKISMLGWQSSFDNKAYRELESNPTFKNMVLKKINDFVISTPNSFATGASIRSLDEALTLLGFEFSPAYLAFSFGDSQDQNAQALRNSFRGVKPLDKAFLKKITEYIGGAKVRHLYEAGDVVTERAKDDEGKNITIDKGLTSMIKEYADANVLFDSTIFLTNFQTADNKTRYSYVFPNYYLTRVKLLKDRLTSTNGIRAMRNDPYFKYNHMFAMHQDASIAEAIGVTAMRKFSVEIAGDIRQESQDGIFTDLQEGVTFRNTDPKSLVLTMLSMYDNRANEKIYTTDASGKAVTTTVPFARFWPFQVEAKNTMYVTNMPVLNGMYANGSIQEAIRPILKSYLMQEVVRMRELTKPMEQRPPAFKIKNKINKFTSFPILNSTKVDELLDITRDSKGNVTTIKDTVTDSDFNKLVSIVASNINKEIADFKEMLIDLDIVKVDPVNKALVNNNLSDYALRGPDGNLSYEVYNNYIGNYYINQIFASLAAKQLILGDESQFSSLTDLVKRAGGANANGISRGSRVYNTYTVSESFKYMYKDSFTDGNLDTQWVTKDAKETDAEFRARLQAGIASGDIIKIDSDDGGSEMTTKEFIDLNYDFARLSRTKLKALKMLEAGIKPSQKEEFRLLMLKLAKEDGISDLSLALDGVAMKLVSFGGPNHNIYFDKMSVSVLFKNYTSRWDEDLNKWVPQKGREFLHNKRVWMEKNGIGQANPASATKLNSFDVFDSSQFNDVILQEDAELPDSFKVTPVKKAGNTQRLQVEVESHGISSVSPMSQMMSIVDSELSPDKEHLREKYQSALSKLRNSMFDRAMNVVDMEYTSPDGLKRRNIKYFLDKVRDIVSKTSPNRSLIEYLEGEGLDTKYDFNLPSITRKLENILFSHMSKEGAAAKLPGRSFILRSSNGYNLIVDKDTGEIIDNDKYLASPKTYETDQYVTRPLRIHKKVGDNISYAEVLISRGSADLMGLSIGKEIPQEFLTGVASRIPGQSHHSVIKYVVAGFLDDYMADTMLIPSELVYISGADFDIDKLFSYLRAFYYDSASGELKAYGSADNPKARYKEYMRWERKNNKTLSVQLRAIEDQPEYIALNSEIKELVSLIKDGTTPYLLESFEDIFLPVSGTQADIKQEVESRVSEFFTAFDNVKLAYGESPDGRTALSIGKGLRDQHRELVYQLERLTRRFNEEVYKNLGLKTLRDFEIDPELTNTGALFNKFLDANLELLNNIDPQIVESMSTPASTKHLDAVADYLEEITGYSVNNLIPSGSLGILNSWITNKEGKDLVGIWAAGNIQIISLTKNKIPVKEQFAIKIDGDVLNTFGITRENDIEIPDPNSYEQPEVVTGIRRKGDTISSGISGSTDNAKNLTMGRLGFTEANTGVAVILSGLGMGATRIAILMKQPILKELTAAFYRKNTAVDPSPMGFSITSLLKQVDSNLHLAAAKEISDSEARDALVSAIKTGPASTKLFIDNLKHLNGKVQLSEVDQAAAEYHAVKIVAKAMNIQEDTLPLGKILSLNRGLKDSTAEEVLSIINAAEYFGLGGPTSDSSTSLVKALDIETMFKGEKADLNILDNVKMAKRMYKVAGKFLLKATPYFTDTYTKMFRDTFKNFPVRNDTRATFDKQFSTFIAMRMYNRYLESKGINLNDNAHLVYNTFKEDTLKVKFTKLLKESKEFSSNHLIRFIRTNTKGILDIVGTNSRLKLSEAAENRFIDAYDALLHSSNPEIVQFARGMFMYLLIKDGMNFVNSSYIKFLKPSTTINMAHGLKQINWALYYGHDDVVKLYTGLDPQALAKEFIVLLGSDMSQKYAYLNHLPLVEEADDYKISSALYTKMKDGSKRPVYKFAFTADKSVMHVSTASFYKDTSGLGSGRTASYFTAKNDEVNGLEIYPSEMLRVTDEDGKIFVYLYERTVITPGNKEGYKSFMFKYRLNTVFGTRQYNSLTLPLDFSRDAMKLHTQEFPKFTVYVEQKDIVKTDDVQAEAVSSTLKGGSTIPKKSINVWWGADESPTSTKLLSNLAPRPFNYNGRRYGSVEHAYQSNKNGFFDEATYKKYFSYKGFGVKISPKLKITPDLKAKMAFSYGNNKRPDVESLTTFEAVKAGKRTGTTRYESDGNIDYFKSAVVGSIIEFRNDAGETLLVRVTKPLHKLSESSKTAEDWSKIEGWSVEYYESKVKPRLEEAWQIEYEYIKDTLDLMEELVVESFTQSPPADQVAMLLNYDNFTHSSNGEIDKAFLRGLYKAKTSLQSKMPLPISKTPVTVTPVSVVSQGSLFPTLKPAVSIVDARYSKALTRSKPTVGFVYTENAYSYTAFRTKVGGGTAVIRPEPNAYAVVTKKKYDYNTKEDVDYENTAEDFKEFVEINTMLLDKLQKANITGIVFPKGFATDKAKMPTKFALWLQSELFERFGLVTELNKSKTGLTSVSVQSKDSLGVPQSSDSIFENNKFVALNSEETHYVDSRVPGSLLRRVTNFITEEFEESELLKTSQLLGRKVDSVVRDIFAGAVKQPEEYDLTSNEEFSRFVSEISKVATTFKGMGYTAYPYDVVVYDHSLGMAGTLDILFKHTDGYYAILDIKSMKGNNFAPSRFGVKYDSEAVFKKTGELKADGSAKYEVVDGLKQDSKRTKHAKQLSLYKTLAQNTNGISVKELFILPVELKYNSGDTTSEVVISHPIIPVEFIANVTPNEVVQTSPVKVEDRRSIAKTLVLDHNIAMESITDYEKLKGISLEEAFEVFNKDHRDLAVDIVNTICNNPR